MKHHLAACQNLTQKYQITSRKNVSMEGYHESPQKFLKFSHFKRKVA